MNRWACHGVCVGVALSLLFIPPAALAQESQAGDRTGSEMEALKKALEETRAEFEKMKTLYEDKIHDLEGRLKKLEETPPAAAVKVEEAVPAVTPSTLPAVVEEAVPAPPPAPPLPPTRIQIPIGGRALIFDLSLTGDIVANFGDNDFNELRNRIFPREFDIAFQGAVDPFMRADVFFEFAEEEPGEVEVGIEEAYATLLTLPFGLQSRIGVFRPKFGRINLLHSHALPQVDRPFVIRNFLGEEGLRETGVSLSAILPTPFYQELDVGAFNGDNEEAGFGRGNLRRPLVLAHLTNFFDLTENAAFQLGISGATGEAGEEPHFRTSLVGVDLTYKWKPLDRPYKGLTLQSEFLYSHRKVGEEEAVSHLDRYGFYVFGEYRLSQRWFVGARYDWSQFPTERGSRESGISPVLTFWPSEFSQFRVQYTHTDRNFGRNSDELFFEVSFGLGPHAPHPF